MTDDNIIPTLNDDGLTEKEMAYLQTPVSQLSKDEMRVATSIFEKRSRQRYAANEAYRNEQRKKGAL